MNWIGQHIWSFISRFRSDVYLEDLDTSTQTNVLVVDSDGKITKNTSQRFTLTADGGVNQTIAAGESLDIAGGSAITTHVGATDTVTINHDDTSSQASSNNSDNTVIQDITLDTYGHVTSLGTTSIDSVENAVLATDATSITATANNTTDETVYPTFVDGATGSQGIETDTGLTYNPGTNILTAVNFAGALTGNADTVTTNANLTGHVTSSGNATTLAATQPTIESIGTDGDTLNVLGDRLRMVNSTQQYPIFDLFSTHNSVSGPTVIMRNQRTDGGGTILEGVNDDFCGTIHFQGYNDSVSGPEVITMAQIDGQIADKVEANAAGKLNLRVAEYDGTVTAGLVLDGDTNADGEIDVTIGAGAASVTTVAGTLTMGSTAALTNAGLVAVANQSNITGVGTIGTGVWNATKILSPKTTHVLNYSFRGLCQGIASGNFQYAEDMLDPQFPFQLNTDYGNTVIANGDLPDVSTYFRSSGVVMPRACTAIDMVGWATCPGTGEVTISLCKITPTRDDATTDPTPVVVATTTFTALNSNDKLENFFVGNTADDGQVTIVTAAIAKGDILMPFVISPNTKTAYFNMTLDVEF